MKAGGLAAGWGAFGQLIRFGLVGGVATLTYIASQAILIRWLGLHILVGTSMSLLISVTVSYLGHHRFTFNAVGDHRSFASRFVIVTAVLIIASNALAYLCSELLPVDDFVASLSVTPFYPIASYILNKYWVFAER